MIDDFAEDGDFFVIVENKGTVFGIVGFLGDLLNIEPIKLCTNFISNAKYL